MRLLGTRYQIALEHDSLNSNFSDSSGEQSHLNLSCSCKRYRERSERRSPLQKARDILYRERRNPLQRARDILECVFKGNTCWWLLFHHMYKVTIIVTSCLPLACLSAIGLKMGLPYKEKNMVFKNKFFPLRRLPHWQRRPFFPFKSSKLTCTLNRPLPWLGLTIF